MARERDGDLVMGEMSPGGTAGGLRPTGVPIKAELDHDEAPRRVDHRKRVVVGPGETPRPLAQRRSKK
jgi:hypothetical protein